MKGLGEIPLFMHDVCKSMSLGAFTVVSCCVNN